MESKYVYTIEKNGKTIYVSDWTNQAEPEEAIKRMNETTKTLLSLGKTNILEVVDVTGSLALGNTLQHAKEVAAKTKHLSRKKAIVGLTGTRKVFMTIVNYFVGSDNKAFDTMDEAIEWLIQD